MTIPQDVENLVKKIKPLLAGNAPELLGAALAELLSIWLAGHVVVGDPEATGELRAKLLAAHCVAVRQLTRVNARMLGTEGEPLIDP
jgi:hypothetical protein